MVIPPARRAGDPGSIPGPGENFSLKLVIRNFIVPSVNYDLKGVGKPSQ